MFADVIAPELLSIVILKGNFDINLLINQTSPLLQGLKRCFVFFFLNHKLFIFQLTQDKWLFSNALDKTPELKFSH
jgi:hypothetical protein